MDENRLDVNNDLLNYKLKSFITFFLKQKIFDGGMNNTKKKTIAESKIKPSVEFIIDQSDKPRSKSAPVQSRKKNSAATSVANEYKESKSMLVDTSNTPSSSQSHMKPKTTPNFVTARSFRETTQHSTPVQVKKKEEFSIANLLKMESFSDGEYCNI
jgi:hypothetical protein